MKDYQGLALQEVYGMILMMKKLMRWSGAVWAVAEAAVARFSQLFLPPPPVFCITICKKALLLSAFAFTPSVFAADIPLATLSVDNIQVRAAWRVVGGDAQYFRIEGGTLMLRDNIDAAGKPDGVTIIADVEVLDKFSTLNPNYEDLITRVKITTVIMGCHVHSRRFAKSFRQESRSPPNQITMEEGLIESGYVIARRNNDNGYNNVFLHTVTITDTSFRIRGGIRYDLYYMTTSPSLFDYLKWDTGKAASQLGWTEYEVNESETCFAEEIETFQQQQIIQQKTQYLNANAPLISGAVTVEYGVIAVEGRAVTVGTAFVLDGRQHFYLYNVTLANILNELYTPKVIIDDGKAFSIDNKYQSGNRYEYVSNLTAGSDSVHGDKYFTPHEVIVLNHDCPPIYEVIGWKEDGLRISTSDAGKVRKYMILNGTIHTDIKILGAGESTIKTGVISSIVGVDGFAVFGTDLADGDHLIKFSDHFLCGTG